MKVTLQDINDNVPTFDQQFYTVMVSEATNPNTSILAVKVNDKITQRMMKRVIVPLTMSSRFNCLLLEFIRR